MEELVAHKDGMEMSSQDADISGIVAVLEDKRDEAVQDRADTEARWLRDLEQFEGNTSDRATKGQPNYRDALRKTPPTVHLTRTRTLSIAARIINMMVPSNERSWNIEATPVPSLVQSADDQSPVTDPRTGQIAMVPDENAPEVEEMSGPVGVPMRQVTRADLAKAEMEEADKKAENMRKHMDDQLVEGRYNAEQRKVIMDGCKIGTGVLEGPVVAGSFKKSRQQLEDGTWTVQMTEESVPEFKCIDPWCFFPLPAERISRCEGVFIDQLMTRSEIQRLKLLPGFNAEMIDEILLEDPEHSQSYQHSLTARAGLTGETLAINKRYSMWKYTGTLDRKDMETLGVDLDPELDMVDPIIEAWFCNGRLAKIKRHALEGAYRLPYYVWNYEESETNMFGYGVPYFMRDSDRVIQSTWHMILHNAAITAGPQLVRRKGVVEPADGTEEITGGLKQWYLSDPEATVSDAFQVFQIDARIDELSAVHERARQNADEELAFPLLAQGEPSEAVPTSSGIAMLMNASNVVQRRIAQSYDDEIIEPSISAMYDYNMIYLEDNDAKGDMTIRPLGASKLVVKDMQAQHLMVIASMTTNDRFAPLMKDDALLRAVLKAAEIDADSLMLSEEELSGQGPSEAEQADMAYKAAQTNKLNAEAEKLMVEMNKGPEGGLTEAEFADLEYRYARMETDLQIQQMRLEQSALEASKAGDVKLADIQSRFQLGVRGDETKRMLGQMRERREEIVRGYESQLKAREVAMKEVNLAKGFDTFG